MLSPDDSGAEGSYVDYIGVHRRARGRGVAKALLHTVVRDAHERGRNRVDLEVDAESPTGADGLPLVAVDELGQPPVVPAVTRVLTEALYELREALPVGVEVVLE